MNTYKITQRSLRRHEEEFEVEANSKEEAEKKLRDALDEEAFRVYNNDWIVSFEDNKTEKIERED